MTLIPADIIRYSCELAVHIAIGQNARELTVLKGDSPSAKVGNASFSFQKGQNGGIQYLKVLLLDCLILHMCPLFSFT